MSDESTSPSPDAGADADVSSESGSLLEIARLFLKLGIVAFGGPAEHIAMMEDEFVTRRRRSAFSQFSFRIRAVSDATQR